MLKVKEHVEVGVINKIGIRLIRIRIPKKPDNNVIKKSQKLCELIVLGLYNPRFIVELEKILRIKGFRSALYNLPFLFW